MNCELVMLAAGQATRFGSDKRFAELPNGMAMWRSTLQVYLDAGLNGHLVVGANELPRFSELPEGIELHECANASEGMSRSLACGLKRVNTEFALVALADMPFLQVSTVLCLLEAAEDAVDIKAMQVSFKGKPGHPKLLSCDLFSAIYALEGDQGGFSVLDKLASHQRLGIEVNDPGVLRDVDVPADLPSTTD